MKCLSTLALTVLGLTSQVAIANTVSSDACVAGARDFTVTAASIVGCLGVGPGNINGNNDAFQQAHPGWVFIDASDTTGGAHNGWLTSMGSLTSGLSGDFIINSAAYTTYDRIAIAFKSGEGQLDPDWAVFELVGNTFGGTWTISGNQALSHALIYGFGTSSLNANVNINAVPEPGASTLVGLGLVAGVLVRRRKSS